MSKAASRARALLFTFLTATFLGCAANGWTTQQARQPTAAKQAPDLAVDRPVSDPYTGELNIFEDPQRDANLQIGRVMDLLKIKENSRVADIGAGSGWFTVRAAKRVKEGGKVYAVEINQDFLKHIEKRAAKEKLANVTAVLGTEDDPRLPAGEIDAALILKTYHEIAQPVRVLNNLKASLRPGALLGIIDRNGSGDDHGLDKRRVIEEAERAGFELVSEDDFVKPDGMDYFLVFKVAG